MLFIVLLVVWIVAFDLDCCGLLLLFVFGLFRVLIWWLLMPVSCTVLLIGWLSCQFCLCGACCWLFVCFCLLLVLTLLAFGLVLIML